MQFLLRRATGLLPYLLMAKSVPKACALLLQRPTGAPQSALGQKRG
jgi:hypothetical protein